VCESTTKGKQKEKPVVNFIIVFRTHFLYKLLAPKTTKLAFGFEILATKILNEKFA